MVSLKTLYLSKSVSEKKTRMKKQEKGTKETYIKQDNTQTFYRTFVFDTLAFDSRSLLEIIIISLEISEAVMYGLRSGERLTEKWLLIVGCTSG